jgi:hypothetical protein
MCNMRGGSGAALILRTRRGILIGIQRFVALQRFQDPVLKIQAHLVALEESFENARQCQQEKPCNRLRAPEITAEPNDPVDANVKMKTGIAMIATITPNTWRNPIHPSPDNFSSRFEKSRMGMGPLERLLHFRPVSSHPTANRRRHADLRSKRLIDQKREEERGR